MQRQELWSLVPVPTGLQIGAPASLNHGTSQSIDGGQKPYLSRCTFGTPGLGTHVAHPGVFPFGTV